MLENHGYYGLLFKELRTRGVLALVLIIAIFIVPTFPTASRNAWQDFGALTFLAATIVLWSTWLSREERLREHGLIYALPIARSRILGVKLVATFLLWTVLAAGYWSSSPLDSLTGHIEKDVIPLIVFSAPLALLASITALHMRSPITTFATTALFGLGLYGLLALNSILTKSGNVNFLSLWTFTFACAVAAALLLGWLFYLFTRTRLQELSSGRRTWLAFLWIATFYEVLAVLLLTGWRDLWVLVLGF